MEDKQEYVRCVINFFLFTEITSFDNKTPYEIEASFPLISPSSVVSKKPFQRPPGIVVSSRLSSKALLLTPARYPSLA